MAAFKADLVLLMLCTLGHTASGWLKRTDGGVPESVPSWLLSLLNSVNFETRIRTEERLCFVCEDAPSWISYLLARSLQKRSGDAEATMPTAGGAFPLSQQGAYFLVLEGLCGSRARSWLRVWCWLRLRLWMIICEYQKEACFCTH